MKKIYIITLLALFIGLISSYIHAQNRQIGTWKIYPTYINPPQKVIETDDLVYYTSGGNLFSYDKENEESYSYTTENKLNDVAISNIYYNYEKKYLVVCYQSSNIDIIYDNGRVKNLSDIKDSQIPPPFSITNVTFDGDNIYVATTFGLVKFNEPKGEVVTSGNYGKKINALCVVGDRLVVHAEGYVWWINKNSMLKTWNDYSKMYNNNDPIEMFPLGDDKILVMLNHTGILLAVHTLKFNDGTMSWKPFVSSHTIIPSYISRGKDGNFYYFADNALYTVDLSDLSSPKEVKLAPLSDDIDWKVASSYYGKESIWSLTREGLANYSADGEGGMTMLMDRSKPDAFSVTMVRYFYPSPDGKRLYAQNSGETTYRFGGSNRGLDNVQTAGYIDLENENMVDITAYPLECNYDYNINSQKYSYGKYAIAPNGLAVYPSDPDTYFLATANDGMYKIKGTEVLGDYTSENSPMWNLGEDRNIINSCTFDRGGNLWVSMWANNYKIPCIMILPASKVALDPSEISVDDWIQLEELKNLAYWGGHDNRMLNCKHSNLIFFIQENTELFVCDTRGTFNNLSDDKYYLWEGIPDQDGVLNSSGFLSSICEDHNGKIWIGSTQGIFEISPSNAMNPNAVFTHLKIPRNDGTNLADYLLGSELCMDISVDAANRKWVATYGSGLYLVSPAGDEILAHFTEDNSPLLSNNVNCVYADPRSGVVYIGTDLGLLSYASDATPAKDSYDEIFIYPNPVKPEFRGDVNITGLMDNSLVKIADAAGQVVAQGRSEGGRFVWNACNSAGVRVKSGVYYVMVSQNASGSASGAVAKIMVIN